MLLLVDEADRLVEGDAVEVADSLLLPKDEPTAQEVEKTPAPVAESPKGGEVGVEVFDDVDAGRGETGPEMFEGLLLPWSTVAAVVDDEIERRRPRHAFDEIKKVPIGLIADVDTDVCFWNCCSLTARVDVDADDLRPRVAEFEIVEGASTGYANLQDVSRNEVVQLVLVGSRVVGEFFGE